NIVSVTFSGSVPEADIRIQEYSGIDTVNPLDTAAGAAGSRPGGNSGAGGSGFTTITPHTATLTQLQTQQFSTNAPSGTTLNWSVDGVAGGNGSVGTITSGGLYTPPAIAGVHKVTATNAQNSANTVSVTAAVTDLTA